MLEGNIGCRFGFESSYAASDVPPSITPLTADRMKYVDLNVHDLIAGVFYSRSLSPDMWLFDARLLSQPANFPDGTYGRYDGQTDSATDSL